MDVSVEILFGEIDADNPSQFTEFVVVSLIVVCPDICRCLLSGAVTVEAALRNVKGCSIKKIVFILLFYGCFVKFDIGMLTKIAYRLQFLVVGHIVEISRSIGYGTDKRFVVKEF